MLKQDGNHTLERLTKEANLQIARQVPKGSKNRYEMATGSILSELRRVYEEFENLPNRNYCILGCRGYGNCAVFSRKTDRPLKVEVSVKDFGTNFQCGSLELVQETSSLEMSRVPKLSNETRIFFSSNLKGVDSEKKPEAIESALSFVGNIADEKGNVKFGVPTRKGVYGITVPKEALPLYAIRFLKRSLELEKGLENELERQFGI